MQSMSFVVITLLSFLQCNEHYLTDEPTTAIRNRVFQPKEPSWRTAMTRSLRIVLVAICGEWTEAVRALQLQGAAWRSKETLSENVQLLYSHVSVSCLFGHYPSSNFNQITTFQRLALSPSSGDKRKGQEGGDPSRWVP
jgi:hypothetical protein